MSLCVCVITSVLSSSPLQLCHVLTWEPITNVVKGPVSEQLHDDGGGRGGESWERVSHLALLY